MTTTLVAGVVATQSAPSYSREVRPILSEHCFQCHGPDDAAREADLRLDAPGHGRGQELLARIASADRDEVMPPPHTGKTLSREQAERILRALADEEARLRDQARRIQAIPAPGGKDW